MFTRLYEKAAGRSSPNKKSHQQPASRSPSPPSTPASLKFKPSHHQQKMETIDSHSPSFNDGGSMIASFEEHARVPSKNGPSGYADHQTKPRQPSKAVSHQTIKSSSSLDSYHLLQESHNLYLSIPNPHVQANKGEGPLVAVSGSSPSKETLEHFFDNHEYVLVLIPMISRVLELVVEEEELFAAERQLEMMDKSVVLGTGKFEGGENIENINAKRSQSESTRIAALLLLSCVHYSMGDYITSLTINTQILTLDPTYCEAMGNIGTSLRALGKLDEAEKWWWKAIKFRPGYFDAVDNLLGVLCRVSSTPTAAKDKLQLYHGQVPEPSNRPPRYDKALLVCNFVLSHVFDHNGNPMTIRSRIKQVVIPGLEDMDPNVVEAFISATTSAEESSERLRALGSKQDNASVDNVPLIPITSSTVSRIQSIQNTAGNLHLFLNGRKDSRQAFDDYCKSVEFVLQSPNNAISHSSESRRGRTPSHNIGMIDSMDVTSLLIAIVVIGLIVDMKGESSANSDVVVQTLHRMLWPDVYLKQDFDQPLTSSNGGSQPVARLEEDLFLSAELMEGEEEKEEQLSGVNVEENNQSSYPSKRRRTTPPFQASQSSQRRHPTSIALIERVNRKLPILIPFLLSLNGGKLPLILFSPSVCLHLKYHLFSVTGGVLPVFNQYSKGSASSQSGPAWDSLNQAVHSSNQTTTLSLLSLAKLVSEWTIVHPNQSLPLPGLENHASGGASFSAGSHLTIVLPLFYAALSIYPTGSGCNNLGIILSGLGDEIRVLVQPNESEIMKGSDLAKAYYNHGLQLSKEHPHLLTNLGSIFKDEGNLPEAIKMYEKAIRFKPDFDVALANLANAIKDSGKTHAAIPYYKRAVEANPAFSEAATGLANSLGAVCDWVGRGKVPGEPTVTSTGEILFGEAADAGEVGWMSRLLQICEDQVQDGYTWGEGAVASGMTYNQWIDALETAGGHSLGEEDDGLKAMLFKFYDPDLDRAREHINEGGFCVRLIQILITRTQRRWYLETFGSKCSSTVQLPPIDISLDEIALRYQRPKIPSLLSAPVVPSVLPFHTFSYPLPPRILRLICHRNALRTAYQALSQAWLPKHVIAPPPPPPNGVLKIGWISSDFGNHPLGHLTQHMFGYFDTSKFNTRIYATTTSDGSDYRKKIEAEPGFRDISSLSNKEAISLLAEDANHILVNLNGYTKNARNELFATRVAPVQAHFMGFAGPLSIDIGCDWQIVDPIACVESVVSGGKDAGLNIEGEGDWQFAEGLLYLPRSYFVNDHKQSFLLEDLEAIRQDPQSAWEKELKKRKEMRTRYFPDISEDWFIFCNFNQLYKIDPQTFYTWLQILKAVPKSILWLLRFPAAGEDNILTRAKQWAGEEVATRIKFTDVAGKDEHISRGRVADIYLDTYEVNSHTLAVDILWSGTPLITCPKTDWKMSGRVATSIAMSTCCPEMVAATLADYQTRAIELATVYLNQGNDSELLQMRKKLWLGRLDDELWDTAGWVKLLEKGLQETWKRWVKGDTSNRSIWVDRE